MKHIQLGVTILAFLALTSLVWASESDELREKAKAMRREAAELAEHGHQDEAMKLKRKAVAMLEEAERLQQGHMGQRHPEITKLKQWLEKLRQEEERLVNKGGAGERLADVRREAAQIEAKLDCLWQQPHDEQTPLKDIARRLEHMRIAVEHLNHARLHHVAKHVAQRAEAAERELHGHQKHRGDDVMHEIMKQLDELRHEVGRVRDEVSELRETR